MGTVEINSAKTNGVGIEKIKTEEDGEEIDIDDI